MTLGHLVLPSARWLQSGASVLAPTLTTEVNGSTEAGADIETVADGVLDADLWTIRAERKNDCATIDRRGTIKNVEDVNCAAKMTFICEFDAESAPEKCMVGWLICELVEVVAGQIAWRFNIAKCCFSTLSP